MKRKIGAFIIMMVMMLSLAACGKVPEEKQRKWKKITIPDIKMCKGLMIPETGILLINIS